MVAHTSAPWGEIAPGSGLLTADEFFALPDDGHYYELVAGRLIRMPPEGGEASTIGAVLLVAIGSFVLQEGLGRVTGEQGGYHLGDNTVLAPDVGFMRAERVPPHGSEAYTKAWPGAPDLVVEVASPSQSRWVMADKARVWLAHGAALVWVVWPRRREVDVWRPGQTAAALTLAEGAMLQGEDVLPGFSFPIARAFA